jgi:hypothetical protein
MSASGSHLTSTLTDRLGFLDGCFVVPTATARSFADAQWALIGSGLGFLVATSAESRPAPGGELVDLCGPVIETRIHRYLHLPWRFAHAAPDSFASGY